MRAKRIEWDVDMDEVFEKLDELLYEKAAEVLEIPSAVYASMTTSERYDYAYDVFHHRPGKLYDFLGLPEEVDLNIEIEEEEVADYLSDQYGYCIRDLKIESNTSIGTFSVDVQIMADGTYDVYLAHEGSSGEHYTRVTAERIGELVSDLIDCVAGK